jgi:hypothetical protein
LRKELNSLEVSSWASLAPVSWLTLQWSCLFLQKLLVAQLTNYSPIM